MLRLVKGNKTDNKVDTGSDSAPVDAATAELEAAIKELNTPTVDMRTLMRQECSYCKYKWIQPVAAIRCPMCKSYAVTITGVDRENAKRV